MKRSGKESWKMGRSLWAEEVREKGRQESVLMAMVGGDNARHKQDTEDYAVPTGLWTWYWEAKSLLLRRKAEAWKTGPVFAGLAVKLCHVLYLCPILPTPALSRMSLTSSCCFRSWWSWTVPAWVPPGPSSSSEKGRRVQSCPGPTIHMPGFWLSGSLFSKHFAKMTQKDIDYPVLWVIEPIY